MNLDKGSSQESGGPSAQRRSLYARGAVAALEIVLFSLIQIVVFPSLHAAPQGKSETLMVAATAIGFVAVAAFFSSDNAFSMLSPRQAIRLRRH